METVPTENVESTAIDTRQAGHTVVEQRTIQEYEKSTDHGLVAFIKKVRGLSDQKYRTKISYTIGIVTQQQVQDVKKLTGVDVSEYRNAITGGAIDHITKRHGEHGIADSSMRNDADIARIGYVLENYDSAALLKDENGNPILSTEWQNKDQSKAQMVKFAKKIDGTYYVVEAVPDSGKKTLRVVSAYLQKDSGSSTRLLNMGETPSQLTPKTPAGMATSAVDSIPQLMQTVNTGDEPAAYGDNAEPRFDSNVQDDAAKEQRSAQEQPTVHSLLMETDASRVKNAIERKYLKEYRQTANLQLAEQQKLDKLQAELDALPKDNRQTSRARFLRDEIIKTKNRLQICQSILTRLETKSPLTYLIHREITPAQSAHNAVRNTGKVVQYSATADFSVNIPGKSREFNEGVSRACARVAKLGSIDGKEHLLLLDAKNCNCVYEETGDMNSVGGEAYREFISSHRESEFIFVHDHTTDGYFSEIDMLSLLTTHNLRAFVAVRLDGIIYYVERKGGGVKLGFPDKIYADALKPLTEKVRNGIITMGERTRLREEIIVDHLIQDYTEGLMEFDGRK